MSETLLTITDELAQGLFPDLKTRASSMWIDGRNVYFDDKALKGGLGEYALFSPKETAEVLGLHSVTSEGEKTLFYGTYDKLWKWTETAGVEDVTGASGPYTGTDDNLWSFESWGEFVAATNNVDKPQLYKPGVGTFELMGGLDDIDYAEHVIERTPYAFLINNSFSDKNISWCDTDNIESWVIGSPSLAGDLEARGLNTGIKAAVTYDNYIALFSQDEMRSLDFINSPYLFGINPKLKGIGTVSKAGVVAANGVLFGFGPRGIWVTDGTKSEYIAQGVLHQFIYNNINKSKWQKVCGWHDQIQSTVSFFYPTLGSTSNDRGIGYNYRNGSFTIFNYGRSAAQDTGVFDFGITGDKLGYVYAQSVLGAPSAAGLRPDIPLEAQYALSSGFGELGFGDLGFGGTLDGIG